MVEGEMLKIMEVGVVMEQLKNYFAINHQPDGTHPSDMKELENEVSKPLTKICNLSFKTATELEDWQTAKVIPISLIRPKVISEIIHIYECFMVMLRKMSSQLKCSP